MEDKRHAAVVNKKIKFDIDEAGLCRVMAIAAIKAGEQIIEEKPIIHAMIGPFHGKVCQTCSKESTNLQRCSGCKYVHYCSQDHQIEDWKAAHKKECGAFKKLCESEKTKLTHSTIILAKAYAQLELLDNQELRRYIESLPSNHDKVQGNKKEFYANNAKKVLEAYGDTSADKLNEYQMHLDKLLSNGVLVLGKKHADDAIACALYPAIRKARHSCVPSAFTATNSKFMHRLVACRDIAEGEEITSPYIDLDQDVSWRHAHLKENFGIRCRCAKCIMESKDKVYLTSPKFLKEKMYIEPKTEDDLDYYVKRCREILPEFDYAWFLAFDQATECLMRLGQHEYYYQLLKHMIPKYEKLFEESPLNPVVGRLYHKLACLAHKFGEKHEALKCANKSLELLQPYYNEKHIRELQIIVQHNSR
jgi:MYND finger/SET domain